MSLVPYNLVAVAETDAIGGGKNVFPNASVNVTTSGGGSAQIYSDEAGTSLIALPTTCDSSGELDFFIAPGDYFFTIEGKTYRVKIDGIYPYVIENVAALPSITAVAGRLYELKEYGSSTGKGGGPLKGFVGTITPNNVTTFAGSAGTYFERINCLVITAHMAGALGDGVTDDYTAIERGLAYVRTIKGKLYFTDGTYVHSQKLYYGASEVVIEGETPSTTLKYTGTGTGLAINNSYADSQRERCGLKSITLFSTSGAIAFDFTGGNYGTYTDFEINYTAANAKLIYARGSSGAGPYFNSFDAFSLFGGGDYSQRGLVFERDSSGNLADGVNANVFSNLKRGASLLVGLDIESGIGNLFVNCGFESIKTAMVRLNNLPSYSDTGTATSASSYTLVDTTKSWSATPGDTLNFNGGAVIITSGPLIGQTRRIATNTSNTINLEKPWGEAIGTPTYAIMKPKALDNKFVNIRQEGLASFNPQGVQIIAGAHGNEFSQLTIGSIGSGSAIDDDYGDPSNKVALGDLIIQQYTLIDVGASQSINVVPRLSVQGGIRAGVSMLLEYIQLQSPNYVSGLTTLTVDHGGGSTGAGTPSVVAKLDGTFAVNEAFSPNYNKILKQTANNGIFVHLETDSGVNPSADFIITVAYRVI